MSPSCREFEDLWIEHAGSPGVDASALAPHRASCAACDVFARRVDALVRALRDLERKAAPPELAGFVVAACHEGQRQDRAVAALAALGRLRAPDALDGRVLDRHAAGNPRARHEESELDAAVREHALDERELDPRELDEVSEQEQVEERAERELDAAPPGDEGRLHVPHVLDRLVDEELREPSKALVRRFAGRLPRLAAPAELDERVHRMLATGELARTRANRWPSANSWRLRAAALFVLFGAGVGVLVWTLGRAANSPNGPGHGLLAVRIERVHSAAELTPEARALIGGITGGLSEFTLGSSDGENGFDGGARANSGAGVPR